MIKVVRVGGEMGELFFVSDLRRKTEQNIRIQSCPPESLSSRWR